MRPRADGSRQKQVGPAAVPARQGSKEDRLRSIAPVCARPLFLAAAVGRNQALCKSAGRFGASILRRGAAAPPFILATSRAICRTSRSCFAMRPTARLSDAEAAACFRQFSRQKSRSSVLCDNTQKSVARPPSRFARVMYQSPTPIRTTREDGAILEPFHETNAV